MSILTNEERLQQLTDIGRRADFRLTRMDDLTAELQRIDARTKVIHEELDRMKVEIAADNELIKTLRLGV
jgi:predicted  nucleic acid-binding Zn-ribbon protein